MAKKQHLDDFLREKLAQLPNAPVAGFEKVQSKMAAKNHRGILVLMLIPLLISGLYWLGTLHESDFYPGSYPTESKSTTDEPDLVIDAQDTKIPMVQESEIAKAKEEEQESPVADRAENSVLTREQPAKQPVILAAAEKSDVQTKQVQPNDLEMVVLADAEIMESEAQFPEETWLQNENQPVMNMFIPASQQNRVDDEEMADAFSDMDVRETSAWSVTLNVYPNYTFRDFHIKQGYEDMVNERYEAIINESEKGGFAFNVGLDVRYHIGSNVFIGSGLGYIQMKVNGNYDFEIYSEPVINNLGAIEQLKSLAKPIQISRGIIQEYSFLQVPLHVSYQPWASKKVRLIMEGGFSFIRFLGADGTTIDYQTLAPKELKTETFNNNLASLDFKVGATYMVNDAIGVGLEPTLMYFSGSIYPDVHPVHVVPWSVGLNINLRMRLY